MVFCRDGSLFSRDIAMLFRLVRVRANPSSQSLLNEGILQVFPGSLWPGDRSRCQFGVLVAVDGLHFFWRHPRIWVRKLQAVIGEAAGHHFGVDWWRFVSPFFCVSRLCGFCAEILRSKQTQAQCP